MNKKLKAEWIKELRSGNRKQCRGKLRTKDGRFCALGVLADLVDPKKWQAFGPFFKYDKSMVSLDEKILAKSIQHMVMSRNDRGSSFSDIADFIEKSI